MTSHLDCCIFCLTCRGSIPDPTGRTCTYGMGHEFPVTVAPQQAKRPDASLCALCGLHPKNPASASNGCAHRYTTA